MSTAHPLARLTAHGGTDYRLCIPRTDNPFPASDPAHAAWHEQWDAAALEGARIDPRLERSLDASAYSGPVERITSFAEDEALFEAIMAGAAGFVLKQVKGSDLIDSVRKVARGESLLDPRTTQRVLERILSEKHKRGEAQLESRFDAGVRASREARSEGYRQAIDNLIPQLDAQLERLVGGGAVHPQAHRHAGQRGLQFDMGVHRSLQLQGFAFFDQRTHPIRLAALRHGMRHRAHHLAAAHIQVEMVMDDLAAEAVHQPAHLDDDVLLRRHHTPSTENMTEKAASMTITRKMPSTTERVVSMPTLAALRSTWKPS